MAEIKPEIGIIPTKATVINTIESRPCPIRVEPIVRNHSQRPFVAIFILARTTALANSPIKYAKKEATRIRGAYPKIRTYASSPSCSFALAPECNANTALTRHYAATLALDWTLSISFIFVGLLYLKAMAA